ncbi:MAG: hypothetical protein ACK4S3_06120, partial [Parvibaculum sp.]
MATAFLDPALDPVNAWAVEGPAAPAFDEAELVAVLQREYEAADSEYDRLRDIQNLAHHYYEAKPFGTEDDARSQIVLPDVQEAIDSMQVSILRLFASGDRVV